MASSQPGGQYAQHRTARPQHHNLNVRLPADLIKRLRQAADAERNDMSAAAQDPPGDGLWRSRG